MGAAAALGLLTAIAWGFLPASRAWLLPAVAVGIGVWHHSTWRCLGPFDLSVVTGPEPRLASVRGELTGAEVDPPDPARPRGRIAVHGSLTVAALRDGDGHWIPVRGEIRWRLADGSGINLGPGDEVELSGVLSEPAPGVLPGGFDAQEHYAMLGCFRELRLNDGRDVTRLEAPAEPDWGARFLAWAHAALGRGLPDDAAARLIRAQALGWKPGLTPELKTPFLRAGTLHVFAISGLHIALVAALVAQALRLFGIGRAWCALIVVPVTWGYVAATGWQASAVRSAVMATVIAVGWALRRPSDMLNSLAAAAGVILVFDPSQLFQPGFQLSFAVVAGMALWTRSIEGMLMRWVAFDPLIPESHRPWWQRWLGPPVRMLVLNLSTSLAAWCASLPLVVHYFHLVSPVSLLANLIVVPLSSLCLTANVGALVTSSWWPWLSELFNQSAWVWMKGMMAGSRWAAELPGGHWYVAAPVWPWWILYVVGSVLVPRWPVAGRGWRWCMGVGAGLYITAAIAVWAWSREGSRIVVSAGGETYWCETGAGPLLVNCGARGFGGRVLVPWLRTRGVNRLEHAILAVGEARFAGGWPEVVTELAPRHLAVAPAWKPPAGLAPDPVPERATEGWTKDGWRVLWPETGATSRRADDRAVVLATELGGVRCLLVPALSEAAQRRLVESGPERLRADIVVAGVPTHGEPLTPEFLAAVDPRLVIIGSGERPAPHRLSWAARKRLRAGPWDIHFTDEEGWVEVRLRRRAWQVRTRSGGDETGVRNR